ncbi:hypothetical protein LTS17_010035 [Exophiala oligosperma]
MASSSSSSRRGSQVPPTAAAPNVNLFCSQCDTQIGVFVNEWTRLTSSYVYPNHQGKHFGTEIGNKTQVVPDGVSQKAVQGCTLAEVFCKKCSAALGQYCKAAPTPQQRYLKDEYFYKLSKTYLKDNETNTIIDAIFGYSGDIDLPRSVRPGGEIPRPSVAPRPRWSETPMRQYPESTSSPFQYPESQGRSYQPSSLNHSSFIGTPSPNAMEDRTGLEARIRAQDEKIAAQDQKIQQQDTQVRLLTTLLETLRGTMDDLKTTMREMQSRNAVVRNDDTRSNEITNSPRSPYQGTRSISSNEIDVDRLRTENSAIKARLEDLETTRDRSLKDIDASTVLGKRKRRSTLTNPRAPTPLDPTNRYTDSSCQNELSSTQMPTPQSSNSIDTRSFNESNISRSSSPLEAQTGMALQRAPQASEELGSVEHHAYAPTALGERSQTEKHSDRSEKVVIEAGSDIPAKRKPNSSHAAKGPKGATSPTVKTSHKSNGDLSGLRDASQTLQINPEDCDPSLQDSDVEVVDLEASAPQQSGADNVEFSDDDNGEEVEFQSPNGTSALQQNEKQVVSFIVNNPSSNQDAQVSHTDPPEDGSEVQSGHDLRPRTRRSLVYRRSAEPVPVELETNKRPRRRRSTQKPIDSPVEGRSVAPEPAALPKLVPRRLPHEPFAITTPTSYDQEMTRKKAKLPKPRIQYTTKILLKELKDLGLEEWVDKDRNNPEYRAAVAQARNRQRELNKTAQMMRYGIGENGEPVPMTPGQVQQGPLSLDEAFKLATDAMLVNGSGELKSGIEIGQPLQAGAPLIPAIQQNTNSPAPAVAVPTTARKQREEEIRRRDRLAKAAMEM